MSSPSPPSSTSGPSDELSSLRSKVDSLDRTLVTLLNKRADLSVSIGEAKRASGSDGGRVNGTTAHLCPGAREGHLREAARTGAVLPARRRDRQHQQKRLFSLPSAEDPEPWTALIRVCLLDIPRDNVCVDISPAKRRHRVSRPTRDVLPKDVFEAVRKGKATYGVVPFENSTYGSVVQTLDKFKELEPGVAIRAETYLAAFGQCQKWLERNMQSVECVRVHSTAKAAEMAAAEAGSAAICNISCADLYGLSVVAQDIEDMTSRSI
ncbi:MAG: hypothetical protein BJ554DRAFT_926 [Olpidium bornovanus]|uniref:Prephenate dehydratase domain-containing protein n=1 Tax=Olpidium bornovanus TaxID=278681 RepID=A0A8H7ZSH4_9FUNG|nr:MAG: hypothetical protein BJ554DRAFT_926 [Olpidium bornovanus]